MKTVTPSPAMPKSFSSVENTQAEADLSRITQLSDAPGVSATTPPQVYTADGDPYYHASSQCGDTELTLMITLEETAARYLAGLGYTILHRNVRVGHCEIDVIASDGDELVFAEVRTRRDNPVSAPEDSVGPVKLERLVRAAALWTQNMNYDGFWRIDLVAITSLENGEMKLEHIKNITEPIS